MISKVIRLIQRKTFRDFNTVLVENIFAKALNFFLIVLIARHYGPEQYGIFSLITVSIMFLVPFLDFGMENTAVRFSGQDPEANKRIFSLYFFMKTGVLILAMIFSVIFPAKVFAMLGEKGDSAYLGIILAGLIIESYLFIFTTYLQAREQFMRRAFINVGTYMARLVAVLFLLKIPQQGVLKMCWVYALGSLPFLVWHLKEIVGILKCRFIASKEKKLVGEMLQYEKWLFIGSVSVNIMSRIDFYAVAHYLNLHDVGLYNSAFQLLAPFTMLPFVLGKVFLPKVSKISDPAQASYLMKNIFALFVIVAVGVVLLLPTASAIVTLLYGADYTAAGPVFQTLLISFVFSFWSSMLSLAHYYFKAPQFVVIGAYAQLVIFLVVVGPLVGGHGILGVAWARTVSAAAQAAVVLVFMVFSWRTRRLAGRP